ncbi:MAG: aconitate hydratase AcnA [Deltaproteobacteria bacterium]|nr:aconitate hydratase AcnA [Deltaproteobacteria bacterium]
MPRPRGSSGRTAPRTRSSPRSSPWTWARWSRVWPGRSGPKTGCRSARSNAPSASRWWLVVNRWVEEGGSPSEVPEPPVDPKALGRLLQTVPVEVSGQRVEIGHGSVAIAAITSCTNTSNPAVMLGAGLLAKKTVERGLTVKPWVKTSLAPGSRVVTEYLRKSGLLSFLEQLRFHLVGYGCTTCIGNSGPLPDPIARGIGEGNLVVAAVLSGNRNFEGRIHPLVRANYLASPMLVVAYALVGRMEADLLHEPLGHDSQGKPVYLRDIWPTQAEIVAAIRSVVSPEMFREVYARILEGDEAWRALPVPTGQLYEWDAASTYVRQPPFFDELPATPPRPADLRGLRVLAMVGDSVTTDHISPAGSIQPDSPAGKYLIAHGVVPKDFNSYGARRGNHEVMMRGTFANIRLRNLLVPDVEGGFTARLPNGERMTIYDAAMRYQKEGVPLIILAGKEYGSGSSRDWAAKGVQLLGVRTTIAESYERIHRSNLVGMGVLPLQFEPGQSRAALGLTGHERFDIEGLSGLTPARRLRVRAVGDDGRETVFTAIARVDSPVELDYYRHGGILPFVLRRLMGEKG